jgi:hypothetical protein
MEALMARTFKVEIDEEGKVVGFEPPSGVKVTRDVYLTDKSVTFSNVTRIIHVPIEIIRGNPECCVHLPDCRTICWPC